MLVKLSNGTGGWHLVDNVERCNLPGGRRAVRDPQELASLVPQGSEMINLIPKEAFADRQAVDVGVVEFLRNGQWATALFTSVAFICNDAGDTIERVNAGNPGNRGYHQKGRR